MKRTHRLHPQSILQLGLALVLTNVTAAHVGQDIEKLTGAQTKIVWLRAVEWDEVRVAPGQTWSVNTNRYVFKPGKESAKLGMLEPAVGLDGGGRDFGNIHAGHWADKLGAYAVYGLDSRDGRERELAPVALNYNPLVSPDGTKVVYTAGAPGRKSAHYSPKKEMFVVDWDGTNRRRLGSGYGQWVWRDPATGVDWVYFTADEKSISRLRLDQPEVTEPVAKVKVNNRLSISADGRRAGGEFPWPKPGLLNLETGELNTNSFRRGCNTYVAPDNSYRLMIMSGSHVLVTVSGPDGLLQDVRIVPPGLKPLQDGTRGVVWNPKWTSDGRGLTVNGPVKNLGSDVSDIWIGRWKTNFTVVEKWVQVTSNKFCDTYAYAWVAPGPWRSPPATAAAALACYRVPGPTSKTIPRIVLLGTLVAKSATPNPDAIRPYVNALVVYEYRVNQVQSGTYAPKTIRVAQWGLRSSQPTALTRVALGTQQRIVVEPFNANPRLESQFLHDTLEENFDLELYVEVGAQAIP